MVKLHFAYPVCLIDAGEGQVLVSCRDLPELSVVLPLHIGLLRHLDAAEALLDVVVNKYISQGRSLPPPSIRKPGEHVLAPAPDTIVRAMKHLGL